MQDLKWYNTFEELTKAISDPILAAYVIGRTGGCYQIDADKDEVAAQIARIYTKPDGASPMIIHGNRTYEVQDLAGLEGFTGVRVMVAGEVLGYFLAVP